MTTASALPEPIELQSVDTTAAEWLKFPLDGLGVDLDVLPLTADPDTGMMVMKLVYKAGFNNRWHTHHCAHGIYVLDGVLTTHAGSYGPGSWVWFPEGGRMEHGASPDGDATLLFVTNKPFDITYCFDSISEA